MKTLEQRVSGGLKTPRIATIMLSVLLAATACKPSDVLSVPPPVGVIGSSTLNNQAGAENELTGATAQLFQAASGSGELLEFSDMITDEFGFSAYEYFANIANIDARFTAGSTTNQLEFQEAGDAPLQGLLTARSSLLVAAVALQKYEPPSGQSKTGEAYALAAYGELLMAEDYCAGVPLSAAIANGGVVYGTPLTTDSLLGTAEAHFRTALTYAAGNDTVVALASIGLGRTLLDRAQFAQAAAAVVNVPTGFVYNMVGQASYSNAPANGFWNIYNLQLTDYECGLLNMSDREGGNGLNFVSAQDPRLVVDSTLYSTCDGGTWYYPIKFGNPAPNVPLATGVEARLIAAEAALQGGNAGTWAADLNTLRGDAGDTKVTFPDAELTIPADSSTAASADQQVDVMFRERAFWLYGTGTRLGDLRRLVRQYGREQSTVWPTGTYPNGNNPNLPSPLPIYGTDVSFTLPTSASGTTTTNPNYKGCLSPTSTS